MTIVNFMQYIFYLELPETEHLRDRDLIFQSRHYHRYALKLLFKEGDSKLLQITARYVSNQEPVYHGFIGIIW